MEATAVVQRESTVAESRDIAEIMERSQTLNIPRGKPCGIGRGLNMGTEEKEVHRWVPCPPMLLHTLY